MPWLSRKTARLRFGRVSVPGASYFLTFGTKDRVPILAQANVGAGVCDTIRTMHESGDCHILAATVMPDHVHLLLTLGHDLTIGQVMGKLKVMTRNQGKTTWRWQAEGFEHRVRSTESIEDFGFYTFMNPYRAGLCPLAEKWSWWFCPNPSQFLFLEKLESIQSVPHEWLGLSDKIAGGIATGDGKDSTSRR